MLRSPGWVCALCMLLLLDRSAIADPGLSPPSPPSVEKISSLIRDLGREYVSPPLVWGGAETEASRDALQIFRETCERTASRAAMQELLRIGKPAVAPLVAALRSAEGRKAQAIAQILGAVGGHTTLYPLLRLADDPDQVLRARLAAAVALAQQGDPSEWLLLQAGVCLSGEWLLLADTLSEKGMITSDLDRARLKWFHDAQQQEFTAGVGAMRSLAPRAPAASVPIQDVWATIVAWDKCWSKGHPFLAVQVVADDPWHNRFWCERTLGTLSEYGPPVGEMRRGFIDQRLRALSGPRPVPLARLMEELEAMSYGAEPFPAGSKEAQRFSLSGYVRSGMVIRNYGYDRKTGAWLPLDTVYFGVNGDNAE